MEFILGYYQGYFHQAIGVESLLYTINRSIIELKKDISSDLLSRLKGNIEDAFSNRVGTVKNTGKDPYHLEFAGGEDKFGCLEFGMLCVEEQQDVIPYIEAWNWIDEECPDESCDMLEEISIPVR